mgnify:CR=1 FL=1
MNDQNANVKVSRTVPIIVCVVVLLGLLFINCTYRLDEAEQAAIIQFGALTVETIRTVVDKFLVDLQVQLDQKKVLLNVDESAVDWFVKHGYSESMGARPMARLIQEKLKKELIF